MTLRTLPAAINAEQRDARRRAHRTHAPQIKRIQIAWHRCRFENQVYRNSFYLLAPSVFYGKLNDEQKDRTYLIGISSYMHARARQRYNWRRMRGLTSRLARLFAPSPLHLRPASVPSRRPVPLRISIARCSAFFICLPMIQRYIEMMRYSSLSRCHTQYTLVCECTQIHARIICIRWIYPVNKINQTKL